MELKSTLDVTTEELQKALDLVEGMGISTFDLLAYGLAKDMVITAAEEGIEVSSQWTIEMDCMDDDPTDLSTNLIDRAGLILGKMGHEVL